jgi:hypothetical protein
MNNPKNIKPHAFELRPRKGAKGQFSSGADLELYMDGVKMRGVRSVNLSVLAMDIGVLTLEVYGQFSAIGGFEPVIKSIK